MLEARRFHSEQKEETNKLFLVLLRWIGALIWNKPVYGYKTQGQKKPEQLMSFYWEKQKPNKELDLSSLYGYKDRDTRSDSNR